VPVGYRAVEFEGQVIQHLTAKGSKSERQAVYLETPEGSFALRRRGGNPFVDPVLQELVGKTLHVKGVLTEHTLIMDDWTEI